MENKDIFTFNYDLELTNNLRNAVNDNLNISINKKHELQNKNEQYFAWDRICAIMDRLDDTLQYINDMKLGQNKNLRSAFDFYEYINCAYVVIECIKTIGRIFLLPNEEFSAIENCQEIFTNTPLNTDTDDSFFDYIRSLCSVHPICTNNRKYNKYLNGALFHCCPFVIWKESKNEYYRDDGDLVACIYTSLKDAQPIHLSLYVDQFDRYLKKWINIIPKIIDAIKAYNNSVINNFRIQRVKDISEYDDIVEYLSYLKQEYTNRFGDDIDDIFDGFIRVFTIELSDKSNDEKLQKYQNAIRYSLTFLKNKLQNMSDDGFDNTGIKHTDDCLNTDLFTLLDYPTFDNNSFTKYNYNLSKICDLEPSSNCDYVRKRHVRILLNEIKQIINEYVSFTNDEPDEEVIVLVNIALYLSSLTNNSILNKNIPNTDQYRIHVYSDNEFNRIITK